MIDVVIHILNTSDLEGKDERLLPLIAPCYAEKYERMKVQRAKKDELGAGYLLYKVLGVSRDEQLTVGEHGKPRLNGQLVVEQGFTEFSLSHTDNYVILAVSTEPVGVDIERCDRLTLPVLKRVLPPGQYEKLAKTTDITEWAKAWTSIEAALKADGRGFSVDPREDDLFMDKWHIESFLYENEFMVSCACREPFQVEIKPLIL